MPFVRRCVDHRYVTLCGAVCIMLLAAGLIGGGFITVIVWPGVEGDFAEGYVEFPPGTLPETIFNAVQRLENAAARVILELTSTSDRTITSSEFLVEWSKEVGAIPGALVLTFKGANANLAEGMKLKEAVCRAGQRRFRAILLTSLSTCMAMLPLIVETDLQAQIVIPMAVSIASGIAFGTLLTLILIPAFLVIMNDFRRMAHRLRTGIWPAPEEVEPATRRDPESNGPANPA